MAPIVFSNAMSQFILLGIVGGIAYYTYFTPNRTKLKVGKKFKSKLKENSVPQTKKCSPPAQSGYHSHNSSDFYQHNRSQNQYLFTDDSHFKKEFLKININNLSNEELLNWFNTLKNKEII